ncbi:BON domain-containing protein [Marisediminicola sp. LYQ85]|uniref:BON domain-containing protein n=1 Tax=Marisediminicola sp. LYQ85 TaxID=3391062 RepID=UPI0039835426
MNDAVSNATNNISGTASSATDPQADLVGRVTAAIGGCPSTDTSRVRVVYAVGGIALQGSVGSMDERNMVVNTALGVDGVSAVGDQLLVETLSIHSGE